MIKHLFKQKTFVVIPFVITVYDNNAVVVTDL